MDLCPQPRPFEFEALKHCVSIITLTLVSPESRVVCDVTAATETLVTSQLEFPQGIAPLSSDNWGITGEACCQGLDHELHHANQLVYVLSSPPMHPSIS